MENWTKENLTKLSVKDLKLLAQKSNINPNYKKAELVKSLLLNNKDNADYENHHSETGGLETSRRMTRSRVSIWQASDDTSDNVKEAKRKPKSDEGDLKSDLKGPVEDRTVKRTRLKAVDNINTCVTSEMFPLVSSIQLSPIPFQQIINNKAVRPEPGKQDVCHTNDTKSKRSKQRKVRNVEKDVPSNNVTVSEASASLSESNERKGCEENQQNSNISVAGVQISTDKPKRNKKRKAESAVPVDYEVSTKHTKNEQALSESIEVAGKNKKKQEVGKIIQDTETSQVEDVLNVTGTSNSNTALMEKLSNSTGPNKIKMSDSLPSNSPDNKHDHNILKTIENKRKSKNNTEPFETDDLSSRKKSEKQKKGRKKVQVLPVEESSEAQESTRLVETSSNNSSLQRSSRRSGSLQSLPNRTTVISSHKKDYMRKSIAKNNNSNGNIMDDISAIQDEIGDKTIQVPIRSSTFILSNSGAAEETEDSSMSTSLPVPKRSATFILSESDSELKTTSTQEVDEHKKHIGHRIMQSSMKKRNQNILKKEQGSTLKSIVKNKTPGSFLKKKASKMPDFKKIHQKLFSNMESLSDNKKRQQDRAQELMSPVVPRCALLTPKPPNKEVVKRNSNRIVQTTKVNTPVGPSPLATKLKTPTTSRTPAAARERVPIASSVNRFGFRKPVKKEEASAIIAKKMPTINMDKRREQDRNVLKGVRMNKRFMLQMQMRRTNKEGDK